MRLGFERVALALFDEQLLFARFGDQVVRLGRFYSDRAGELGGTGTRIRFDGGKQLLAALAAGGAFRAFAFA